MKPQTLHLCEQAQAQHDQGLFEESCKTYASALSSVHDDPEAQSDVLSKRVHPLLALNLPQLALGDAINSVLLKPSCDGMSPNLNYLNDKLLGLKPFRILPLRCETC